ncbi:uncharacterized protein L199_006510 [Kwoniella botswanensis]|uniref:uncharacterized protein n=1 Tax=Kwoniella botswanensis TaxID=1268659 RepID=UPI00315C9AAD
MLSTVVDSISVFAFQSKFLWKDYKRTRQREAEERATSKFYEEQRKKNGDVQLSLKEIETIVDDSRYLAEDWKQRYAISEENRRHYFNDGNQLPIVLFPPKAGTVEVTARITQTGEGSHMSAHIHPLSDLNVEDSEYQRAKSCIISELDTKMSHLNKSSSYYDWISGPERTLGYNMSKMTDNWAVRYPEITFITHTPSGDLYKPATARRTTFQREQVDIESPCHQSSRAHLPFMRKHKEGSSVRL